MKDSLRSVSGEIDHFPKIFRADEFQSVKDVAAAETRGIRSFRESGRHTAFIIPAPHGTGFRPLVTDRKL